MGEPLGSPRASAATHTQSLHRSALCKSPPSPIYVLMLGGPEPVPPCPALLAPVVRGRELPGLPGCRIAPCAPAHQPSRLQGIILGSWQGVPLCPHTSVLPAAAPKPWGWLQSPGHLLASPRLMLVSSRPSRDGFAAWLCCSINGTWVNSPLAAQKTVKGLVLSLASFGTRKAGQEKRVQPRGSPPAQGMRLGHPAARPQPQASRHHS